MAVHADGGAYKPLNWMNAPNTLVEDDHTWVVSNPKGERLTITMHDVLADSPGSSASTPGCRRTVSKRTSRSCSRRARTPSSSGSGSCAVSTRRRSARSTSSVATRMAGSSPSRSSAAARSTVSSSWRATSSGCTFDSTLGDVRGVFVAQVVKPQAECWPNRAVSAGSRSTTTCDAVSPRRTSRSFRAACSGSARSQAARLTSRARRRRFAAALARLSQPSLRGETETLADPRGAPLAQTLDRPLVGERSTSRGRSSSRRSTCSPRSPTSVATGWWSSSADHRSASNVARSSPASTVHTPRWRP